MPSDCAAPHDLLPRTRNVRRRSNTLSAPTHAAGRRRRLRQSAVRPDRARSNRKPRSYDTPDGVDHRRARPAERRRERNQHGRHRRRARDAARRPDAQPLRGARPRSLHAGTARQSAAPTRWPARPARRSARVDIETDLPPARLAGNVYLGSAQRHGRSPARPTRSIIDAESVYGVSVRLEGAGRPEPRDRPPGSRASSHNPQLPFSDLLLKLNGGPRAPLANRLDVRRRRRPNSLFTPWTGRGAVRSRSTAVRDAPAARNPVPFALAQSTQLSSQQGRRLHELHLQPRRAATATRTSRACRRCCRPGSSG